MMDLTEALEAVIARTGDVRYRALCADAHPEHETYRKLVLLMAARHAPAPPPATIPLAESLRLWQAMRACPWWRKRSDCGCSVNGCAFPYRTRLVTHDDCRACLGRTVE